MLVGRHIGHAQPGKIVTGGAEADGVSDARRSGLELGGQIGPGRLTQPDNPDHVATAKERRHRLQQLTPTVQQARPHRPTHLVA